jgi:hypothetical protein
MKPDLLKRGYLRILTSIYSPPLLYQRIRTFLTVYQPTDRPVRLEWNEIYAFLRSILVLGILGPERMQYWRLFFWTLLHKPAVFPLAITLSIYGYHFRKISQELVFAGSPAWIGRHKARAGRAALESPSRSTAD